VGIFATLRFAKIPTTQTLATLKNYMPANIFKIEGTPAEVQSYEEFMALGENNKFSSIIYYPDIFNDLPKKTIHIRDSEFINVSFKDTTFDNVRFVRCSFEKCIFLSARFYNCEFVDCNFKNTNTNKSKFENTYIKPNSFSDNFDLKEDANIAADLYHSLYKNLSSERQPDRAKESLYLMHRAENAYLSYRFSNDEISKSEYFKNKTWHVFHFLTSGYGLKLYRILLTLLLVVFTFSIINYLFRDQFFANGDICTFLDSVYFTLVTLTTLGYGDIAPTTQPGKIVVIVQTVIGISVISLFLSSITSKVVRD